MNTIACFLICLASILSFLKATELIFIRNKTTHSFPAPWEDCPRDMSAYWFSKIPNHCIAPRLDHAADYVPPHALPPGICIFVNAMSDKFPMEGMRESCRYL